MVTKCSGYILQRGLILNGFSILLLVLFFTACGKPKQLPAENGSQQNGGTAPPGGTQGSLSADIIFPHTDNWAEPAVHGDWAVKNGTAVCLRCHTTTQASVEGAPACGSCHILYPHSNNWIQKEVHGSSVLKSGKTSCATQCHGADLSGGLSKVSCTLCHEIYPHKVTWMSPTEHGATAKGDGKVLCIGCHGDNYQGGLTGISCYQCHSKYPHEPDWNNPQKHGAYVVANGTQSCAGQCHGTDLKGGLSGVACSMCHATFPHVDGWETFAGHGDYVVGVLHKDTTACQRCHGTDLRGGTTQVSCFSCHADYPHTDPNWALGAGHGQSFSGRFNSLSSEAGCWNCHGTPADFNANQTAQTLSDQSYCYSCHPAYPHKSFAGAVWEPVLASTCGPRQITNWGHTSYVTSPLFTNAAQSCGQAGSCHSEGYRSFKISSGNAAPCADSCHGIGARVAALPAAIPCTPPANMQNSGPPTIIATTPTNGATQVAVAAPLVMQFSEAMEKSSVEEPESLELKKIGENPLSIQTACNPDPENWCQTATVTPTVALRENTTYQAKVTRGVKDWGGTYMVSEHIWTFMTTPTDVTAPTVTTTSPRNLAGSVSVTPSISITFSEPMLEISMVPSVTNRNAIVLRTASGTYVSNNVGCVTNTNCQRAAFNLQGQQLVRGTRYSITIANTVKDATGNAIAVPYTWTFVTRN